jgi:glycosyltransferase involved in cell wall biosynthesis
MATSETPLVSVLMPAFNAGKFIGKAIQSIIDQDHEHWELLILNDASTDDTASMINSLIEPRIRLLHHTENQGYLESCNELFELAKGEFVTFLDADDLCESNRISECLKAFQNPAKVDFLTTDHARIDDSDRIISTSSAQIDYDRYATDPNYQPTVCCATIFLRSSLLKKVGGYSPFFKDVGGEDYHWLFRLAIAGVGVHLEVSLYHYRTHETQSHHLNENPLKYFFSDIDKEIRTEMIRSNTDLLITDDTLKTRWIQWVESHPSELAFRKASSMLNRDQFKKSFSASAIGLIRSPFSFTSWQRFTYLTYSMVVRQRK